MAKQEVYSNTPVCDGNSSFAHIRGMVKTSGGFCVGGPEASALLASL